MIARKSRPSRQNRADGFIIVAVLWILVALATLASVFSLYISNTAIAARISADRLQADALTAASLELTAYRLIGTNPGERPSQGAFSFRLGGADISVSFKSEGGRIDLNAAPKPLLSGLFAVLGAEREKADLYADHIIYWRKKKDAADKNDEASAYEGLGYSPRQAPFQNIAELKLVQGIPPELAERALPFVTLFNGKAEIDANLASQEVIAALPNLPTDALGQILAARDPNNPKAIEGLLGAAKTSVNGESRKATRVAVEMALEHGRRIEAQAVILLMEDGPDPYRVLFWTDDFDGPT
jgi:general secretion pathway protein K